ncbi:3-oxosteroid 1-dehydrogenase [Solimonas aquatica]|uniref:3-oxosteroid 1-dehydrogenase n=1 Tax=Solimonas aquatica TaxID=489703 RepID=A0A1H9G1J5_9GAMM|nr:FAD-dependent oxidoreductase [Solimonas aquatica]SEQ44025.1 3-oxosteroid 1-dehydrogenase [Solimonas aquatica]
MSTNESYDLVVVGSGAAGAMAALRAAHLGLSVLVVEKARKFGGTSATSGGVLWVPNHQLAPNDDSREKTMTYLNAVMPGPVQNDRLQAYLDKAPEMAQFVKSLGIPISVAAWPDYYQAAPSARADRSLIVDTFDGPQLGAYFPLMREQYNRFKVFGRYTMDVMQFFSLSTRAKGWVMTFIKMFWRYWSDLATRKLTARDRRFTMGAALMGWLYKHVFAKGVEVRLDTRLDELVLSDNKVSGVVVSHFGRRYTIEARYGVVLAAGGFEWNQELRDRYFPVPGLTRHSSTPEDANRGEALIAGLKVGAATEHTESGWWIPTMQMPMASASNFEEIHQAAFDVGRPHSVAVNRLGLRFVDEATGYDDFGKAMVADQLKTGANMPCWLVFDATFREKFSAGGIMPNILMPDRKIPPDWWDHYIFRADSIEALAGKIGVPAETLKKTVANMNGYAKTGVDPEFGRGGNAYDQMFGDWNVKPNPCLGSIDKAPYYAVAINCGDLGTKGGLKADARARVLDQNNQPIPNLYAAGNNAGSPFGNCYPGAGGTIGPAMTFGYVAAEDIARRAGKLAAPAAASVRAAA